MSKVDTMSEKAQYLKKFLEQLDRTFEDAKSCRKCRESCGDIFYNGSKKAFESLEYIIENIKEFEEMEQEELKLPTIIVEEVDEPLEKEEEIKKFEETLQIVEREPFI